MGRPLAISGVAMLLLLALATMVVLVTWDEPWITSCAYDDAQVDFRIYGGSIYLYLERGRPRLTVPYWIWRLSTAEHMSKLLGEVETNAKSRSGLAGFSTATGTYAAGNAFTLYKAPGWPLAAILMAVAAWVLVKLKGASRPAGARCPRCGYDISECTKRCAECGWVMPYHLALSIALRRTAREQMRSSRRNGAAR